MMNFLKKHFIPGQQNDHQPHILRRRAVFLILGVVLIVEFLFLLQMLYVVPYTDIFSAILSNVLVDLANADRLDNNIFALKTNPLLERAAEMKAEDMAQLGYFSHTSPDGKTPWEWLDEVGYSFRYAGENLAVNFSDSTDVERAWMRSESHKKNILNNNFIEIGIGTATGIYKNKEAVFVVQFFGTPAKTKAVVQTNIAPEQEVEKPITEQESTVKGEEIAAVPEESFKVAEDRELLPQPIQAEPTKASIFQRLFTMPKTVINYVYIFIAVVVFIALMFKIFIKIKIQYPKIIFNGVVVLFVIISIFYLNYLIIEKGSIF